MKCCSMCRVVGAVVAGVAISGWSGGATASGSIEVTAPPLEGGFYIQAYALARCPAAVTRDAPVTVGSDNSFVEVNGTDTERIVSVFQGLYDSVGNRAERSEPYVVISPGGRHREHALLSPELHATYPDPGSITVTAVVRVEDRVTGAVYSNASNTCSFAVQSGVSY